MVATQKLPQILQLNPSNEIVFNGPFDKVVTSYLHLKNPSSDRVCFKIKTTAPRRYCVRPNNGIIEPSGDIKIAIMLQPMDEDSQAERSKHKFMVLSTLMSEGDSTATLEEIWQKAGSTGQMDSKLRCVFLTPDENGGRDSPASPTQAGGVTPLSNISSTVPPTTGPTKDTLYQREQTQPGRNEDEPTITTSTPIVSRATSSTAKSWGASSITRDQKGSADEQRFTDKSVASSHNITSSFLQPMSDDYKIMLISLAMLFLGVILGKYII